MLSSILIHLCGKLRLMTLDDKKSLVDQIKKTLNERLQIAVESAYEAKEASTNEESKAENKYDTRGLEAGYLASGQAKRAQNLQEQIFLLSKTQLKSFQERDPVGMSAIVDVEINGEKKLQLFLLPVGGVEILVGRKKIQTITLESPLGQNLIDQKVGYGFELNGKDYEILGVQ